MTILVRSGVVAASRRYALELVRPSSVVAAGSGSSASIVGLGSVDFSAVTSLSLNGVFSAEYDNYMIVCRGINTSASSGFDFRLRSGSTDENGSNYTIQRVDAQNTTIGAGRATISYARFFNLDTTYRAGSVGFLYGPYLAQPTAGRTVSAPGNAGTVWIRDWAVTHSLSTSYDGITFSDSFDGTSTASGNIAVYGLRG